MKSKRRHELQHNVLDGELGKIVDFLKRRGTRLAWGALIAAAIAMVALYVVRDRQRRRLQVRIELEQLEGKLADPTQRPEDLIAPLKRLAEQSDNQRVAASACLDLGSLYVRRATGGGQKLTQPERDSFLDQAGTFYREVLARFPDSPVALAWAHLGLGKLAESRDRLQEAESCYQAATALIDTRRLKGHPVAHQVKQAMDGLALLAEPVKMATTAPAPREKEPTSRPIDLGTGPKIDTTVPTMPSATRPASAPATRPAAEP